MERRRLHSGGKATLDDERNCNGIATLGPAKAWNRTEKLCCGMATI